MTFHQLKVFVTVVRLNSFTHAAKALHISQPSVSGVIQNLQDELGVKLFDRLGNKRKLTEAGQLLFQRAESNIANIEGIWQDIDEIKGLRQGKLVVGGSNLAAASGLTLAVQRFKKQYPGAEVPLILDRSRNLEKKLLGGELDLAVLSWIPQSNLLLTELWRKEDIVVVCPPNHPLTKKRRIALELLAKEPLIGNLESSFVRDMVRQSFAERNIRFEPTVEVIAHSNPRDAVKNAVAGNLGIGFLIMRHVIGDIKSGRIKMLKVPGLDLKRHLYITIHKNRQNPLVPPFIELLKNLRKQ